MQDVSLPRLTRSRESQDVNGEERSHTDNECKQKELPMMLRDISAMRKCSKDLETAIEEDLPDCRVRAWSVDISGQSTASALSICSSVTVASTESKMTLSTSAPSGTDPTFDVSRTPESSLQRERDSPETSSENLDGGFVDIRDHSPIPSNSEAERKSRNSFRKKQRFDESISTAAQSASRRQEKRSSETRGEGRNPERRSSKKRSKRESRRSGKNQQIDTGCCVVTGKKGTRVMREVKLPTVLIKMEDRKFCKGMVHYVVLIPVENNAVKIPGVVMSHPTHPKGRRTTHYAELLPLLTSPDGTGPCTPLLNYKKFRPWFENGARFQLRVLAFGRPNTPWREVNPPPSVSALRKQVTEDIAKFPMAKIRSSEKHDQNSKHATQTKRKSASSRGEEKSHSYVNVKPGKKLSDYLPNLRIRGLSAAGGHRDFASWFASLPPDVKIDTNFQCDTGVLRKDTFRDMNVLDKYLGISEVL